MAVDLLHNKIVAETASESFCESVVKNLLPMLEAKLGGIDLLQMYEDYTKDNFSEGGYWYYPFSAIKDGVCHTVWCKWDISDKSSFSGANPYAFKGEELRFLFADDVPERFLDAMEGRSRFFTDECVKINIHSSVSSPEFLSGKYSQSFVDEMARQLTAEIESAAGVRGIAHSSVELDIVFAPETYMEHTSENVTYRRLLLTAKGCATRDFWVKWTRLGSGSAYSMCDHVNSGDIRFEIGEDVSHKIREKEYRFLVFGNSDKYRNAMGRKNITEWRELIKRALKRGELEKCGTADELQSHASELNDKLGEILARSGIVAPEIDEIAEAPRSPEFEEAMRIAARAAGYRSEDEGTYAPIYDENTEKEEDLDTECDTLNEEPSTDTPSSDEDVEYATTAHGEQGNAVSSLVDEAFEKADEPIFDGESAQGYDVAPPERDESSSAHDERYEKLLYAMEAMRAELEHMKLERAELENRLAERERQNAEWERRIREQTELELKKNEREKELFAEAARIAREENERLIRERDEKLRAERELEARRAAEEREREELARIEAQRAAEVARIEREMVAERTAREEEKKRAEESAAQIRSRLEERRARNEEIARRMAERMTVAERGTVSSASNAPGEGGESVLAGGYSAADTEYGAADTRAEKIETLQKSADAQRETESANAASEKSADAQRETESANATLEKSAEHSLPYVKEVQPSDKVREAPAPSAEYTYTQKHVRLIFRHNVDPHVTARIKEMIIMALDSLGKANVYIKIKASIPEANAVLLNFVKFPEEEMQMLLDIIHILGNSDLGITKIIME